MSTNRKASGFTLIEIMVGAAIASIVVLGALTFVVGIEQARVRGESEVAGNTSVAISMAPMIREMENTGLQFKHAERSVHFLNNITGGKFAFSKNPIKNEFVSEGAALDNYHDIGVGTSEAAIGNFDTNDVGETTQAGPAGDIKPIKLSDSIDLFTGNDISSTQEGTVVRVIQAVVAPGGLKFDATLLLDGIGAAGNTSLAPSPLDAEGYFTVKDGTNSIDLAAVMLELRSQSQLVASPLAGLVSLASDKRNTPPPAQCLGKIGFPLFSKLPSVVKWNVFEGGSSTAQQDLIFDGFGRVNVADFSVIGGGVNCETLSSGDGTPVLLLTSKTKVAGRRDSMFLIPYAFRIVGASTYLMARVAKIEDGRMTMLKISSLTSNPIHPFQSPADFRGATLQALKQRIRYFVGSFQEGGKPQFGLFRQATRPNGVFGRAKMVVPNVVNMQLSPIIRQNIASGGSCNKQFCVSAQFAASGVNATPAIDDGINCAGGANCVTQTYASATPFPYKNQPQSWDSDSVVGTYVGLTIAKDQAKTPIARSFVNSEYADNAGCPRAGGNGHLATCLDPNLPADAAVINEFSNYVEFAVDFKNLNPLEVDE
jgi:prepilin-type N-terminal cleavage/methylation domain-containing protein